MFRTPRRILILALCLMLVLSTTAFAAPAQPNSLKVNTLDINVMPEYDNSDVLILYGIEFVNTSSEPYSGELRFPVPLETTNNIVKERNTGKHLQVEVEKQEASAELVWQPSEPLQPNQAYAIHLEYYYNPLPGTGLKEFDFEVTPSWPVERTQVYLLQPLKAEDMKIEPSASLLGQDDKGFNIFKTDFGKKEAGDPIKLKVSYTKNDPNPSVDPPAAQTSQFTTQPGGEEAGPEIDPMGIGVIIFLCLIAAVVIGIMIKNVIAEATTMNKKQPGRKVKAVPNESDLEKEKRQLRQRLLKGEISEDTYHLLLLEIEKDYS